MSVTEAGVIAVIVVAFLATLICLAAIYRSRREDVAEVVRALAALVRAFLSGGRR